MRYGTLAIAVALVLSAAPRGWANARGDVALLVSRLQERDEALARCACTEVQLLDGCALDMWRIAEGHDVVGELVADPFASPPRQRAIRIECHVLRPEGWAGFESRYSLTTGDEGLRIHNVWGTGKARWECRGPRIRLQGTLSDAAHAPFTVPRYVDVADLRPEPQFIDPPIASPRVLTDSLVHSVSRGDDWVGLGADGVEMRAPTIVVECTSLGEFAVHRRLTYLAGAEPVLVREERNSPVYKRRMDADVRVTRLARLGRLLYASEAVAAERYVDNDGRPVLFRGAALGRYRLFADHPLLTAPWPLLSFDEDAGLIRGPDCEAIFPAVLDEDLQAVLAFQSPVEPGGIR